MTKRLLATLLLMASTSPTWAATPDNLNSGNNWLRICTSDQSANTVTCIAYIMGIESGLQMQAGLDNGKLPFCTPANVTNGQKQGIFTKFLSDHADIRNENAALYYVVSMQQAFPCGK